MQPQLVFLRHAERICNMSTVRSSCLKIAYLCGAVCQRPVEAMVPTYARHVDNIPFCLAEMRQSVLLEENIDRDKTNTFVVYIGSDMSCHFI